MGTVLPLGDRSQRAWRSKIRRDVADLLIVLRDSKQRKLGRPVSNADLVPIDLRALTRLQGLSIEEVEELGGVPLDNPWAALDARVAGMFNPETRVITVTRREPLDQRRFTIAHEFAHALYHSGPLHLRERVVRARSSQGSQPVKADNAPDERVADMFAAECTMPADLVREAMGQRFGGPVDTTLAHEDLAYYLSAALRRRIDPRRLAAMPQLDRAALFGRADSFRGRLFAPLIEAFGVSVEAMAKRLLELDLVS